MCEASQAAPPARCLYCREHGREIPYYEADPKHSVWAATGYGQFSDNLIERVLAGHGGHTDPDS